MRIEEMLEEESGALVAYLLGSGNVLLVLLNGEGKICDCNEGFLRLTGLSEKPTGGAFSDYFSGERPNAWDPPPAKRVLQCISAGRGVYVLEASVLEAGGNFLVIGEKPVLTNQDTLARMSLLYEELLNTTRELYKEKAALERAHQKIRTLSGLLPICSSCKRIRDDKGYWNKLESYLEEHSGAEFSHSICPECAKRLYPDLDLYEDDEKEGP